MQTGQLNIIFYLFKLYNNYFKVNSNLNIFMNFKTFFEFANKTETLIPYFKCYNKWNDLKKASYIIKKTIIYNSTKGTQ